MPTHQATELTSILGIDAGTTATRWLLLDRSRSTVAAGEVPALSGLLLVEPETTSKAHAIVATLCQAVRPHGRPAAVVAGVTGLSAGSPVAGMLGAALASGLSVSSDAVTVVDDMHICYRGAFAPGEGIVVYAGTGSIAYHIALDGSVLRAGGHGYLIDDAGGGFWIGREALSRILRARDAGDPPSPLARALEPAIGAAWDRTRTFIYGGGRAAVAALVPMIVSAADSGDGEAASILDRAGAELARLATLLLDRLGERPVALAGGVAAHERVRASVLQALPASVRVTHHRLPPVDAAARLALELLGTSEGRL